jgi:TonB-dependent siderophore receptor
LLLVRGLLGACFAALGSFTAPTSALAEEPRTYRLKIDAQPLEDALQGFAGQTGIQIVFVSQITNGLRANPVAGEYSLSAGLDVLLAGSGLTYNVLNPLTIAIRRQDPADAGLSSNARDPAQGSVVSANNVPTTTRMEEVVVRGTAEQLVATRTQTPLREIPQTISIISHEQIDQQNDTDFADALSHAPGVSISRFDSLDPDLYVRGFQVTSLHIDGGAALPVTRGNAVRFPGAPDLSEFDHIEVLRGADGLFGGNGNPGATVSLVRKRPQATPALTVDASVGSWNNYRAELDATGSLALDGDLRGRVGGVYIDRDYFYRLASLERRKAFGMLEYQITAATTLALGGSYQSDRALPFTNGLPRNLDGSDPRLPRTTALATDWSYYRGQTHQAWMQVRQRFGSGWTARLNLVADKGSTDSLSIQFENPIDPATGVILDAPTAFGTSAPDTLTHFSSDFTLTGSFDLFGRRTEMAFGGDYTRANTAASLSSYSTFQRAIGNIYAFDPSLYPDPRLTKPVFSEASIAASIQKGVFVSLRLHLNDDWSIIGGTRISNDHLNSHIFSPLYPQFGDSYPTSADPRIVTPYGAVMYDLGKHYSIYMSYADIFLSNGLALQVDGTPLGAQHGTDAEVGMKAAWRDGSLNGTLVAYKIDQYGAPLNVTVKGISPAGCCFTRGVNKSSGADVELNGAVAPGWLLGAGYTYNTNRAAELVSRQPGDVAFASFVPKHLFKGWTSKRLPGLLNRWTVGGNIQLQTSIWRNGHLCGLDSLGRCYYDGGPYRITQSGYGVLDLRAGYQVDSHWRVALRVNNVFDKIYYESIGDPTGNNWYGEPRNFLVRIDGNF